jgi:hypothetical protein
MGIRKRRAVIAAAAVAVASILWAAARLAGADLTVAMAGRPPMEITLGMVATVASLAALSGWALLAVLERVTGRARSLWTGAASLVLLGSLIMPSAVDATVGARLALTLMHLTVGGVLIAGLGATARRRLTDRRAAVPVERS